MSISARTLQNLRDLAIVLTPRWPHTRQAVPLSLLVGTIITALELAAAWVLGVLALAAIGFITRADLLSGMGDWSAALQACAYVTMTVLLVGVWAVGSAAIRDSDDAKRLRRLGGRGAR